MNRIIETSIALIVAIVLFVGCESHAPSNTEKEDLSKPAVKAPHENEVTTVAEGKYAAVNGLQMYYEIHGTGRPLVLLHGAFGMATVFPTLAKDRQVIAIELQGHGHTADIDRPLTMEQMADDTAALLKQLKIDQADFFGYSLGGQCGVGGRDPSSESRT